MLMEVQKTIQRHTNVRLKQVELVLFALCDESFVFCDVAAEISAQVPGPQVMVRHQITRSIYVQGLYVGSAQLLELAYTWDPP